MVTPLLEHLLKPGEFDPEGGLMLLQIVDTKLTAATPLPNIFDANLTGRACWLSNVTSRFLSGTPAP